MLVAIEGGDQAGKLTQSELLERSLREREITCKVFHFPDYATETGKKIRELLGGDSKPDAREIHRLLAENRGEKAEEIKRAQRERRAVIMDRYYHSNIAYGMANKLDREWLERLDAALPRPNLVILLDVPRAESFRRKAERDAFEKDEELLDKIAQNYKVLAEEQGWHVIDATRPRDEIHGEIRREVMRRLESQQ